MCDGVMVEREFDSDEETFAFFDMKVEEIFVFNEVDGALVFLTD